MRLDLNRPLSELRAMHSGILHKIVRLVGQTATGQTMRRYRVLHNRFNRVAATIKYKESRA